MVLGIGVYEGATLASARATKAKLVLAHRCALVVKGLLEDGVKRQIGLRGDDGQDWLQVDENQSPESEARRFFDRFIKPEIFGRPEYPRQAYSWVLGMCENWHREKGFGVPQPRLVWRAAFESTLCDLVQIGLQLPYGWGSIPIGNLEGEDIPLFKAVMEKAAFTAAHLYLGERRKTLAEETDDWYLNRPINIWLPACKKYGVRFPPLMATELGTYFPYGETGLNREEYVKLVIEMNSKLTRDFLEAGVKYIGGMGFGYGTVGSMTVWQMDGTEQFIADQNPDNASIFLPGQETHVPVVGPGFQKMKPYVGEFTEDEIYHGNDGPPQTTTSLAIAKSGYANWRKKTNTTVAVGDDGRVFVDKGNGAVEYAPKS